MPFLRKYTGPLRTAARKKISAVAVAVDTYFKYVTMLLHGDGTNGAQNNTFVDSSTNNYTITRNGNTMQGSFSPYGSNWSNYLGTGNYLTWPSGSSVAFGTGDFTVECWVYLGATPTTNFLFDFRDASNTTAPAFIWGNTNSGVLDWTQNAASGPTVTSTGATWNVNTWYHIAYVRSGTTGTIYQNGVSIGSATDSTNYTVTPSTSRIAARYGSPFLEFPNGYISNVRIVKGTAVYTGAFTPSTTPLTAITNTVLLTCQSNRFIDNSTNNFAITVTGTPSVQRFNPFGTSTAYSTSVIGGSGYFDGSGDYLVTSGTGSFNPRSTFTVEFWTYPFSNDTVTWINSNTNNSFYFETLGTTLFVGDGLINTISTTAPKVNQWTHLLLSFDGTTYRLFYNGVLQTSSTSLLQSAVITAFRIGQKQDGTRPFNGYITDMRVLVGTALYTSTFTPPTAPITAITNTSLLLNYTNGAIFDNAMMNYLETVGNAQISTSVKKYGTGSLVFDETGDYIAVPPSANMSLGTGDFTIECWVRFAANPVGNGQGVYQLTNGYLNNTIRGPACGVENSTGAWTIYYGTTYSQSGTVPTTGVWYHTAFVRSSGTSKLYIDGTSIISVADTTNYTDQYFTIGGWYDVAYLLNGYIDDLRITKGYARYTTNFTPPTAAFADISSS